MENLFLQLLKCSAYPYLDSAYVVDLAYLLADLCSYNDLLLSYQYRCDIWIVPCRVLLG